MFRSVQQLLGQNQGRVTMLEAHDRASIETVRQVQGSDGCSFDGFWISSLTQTTYLGIPDTELISPLQRAVLALHAYDNTSKRGCRPLCAAFDADSGGDLSDVPQLIASLSSVGVSMIVIEDKSLLEPGQKVNSLDDTSHAQEQANMDDFAVRLQAFKTACIGTEMMVTARIESFTTRMSKPDDREERESVQSALRDALVRAASYRRAGADAIMIHSKSKHPSEVLSFLSEFRSKDAVTPIVVVPTTYSDISKDGLYRAGANIVIYANHLMRAKIKAAAIAFDTFWVRRPNFMLRSMDLDSSSRPLNFACYLRKLAESGNLNKEFDEHYSVVGSRVLAAMQDVARAILEGKSAKAIGAQIITVEELLRVNCQQTTLLGDLFMLIEEQPIEPSDEQSVIPLV